MDSLAVPNLSRERISTRALYLVLGLVIAFAGAEHIAFSIGAIEWRSHNFHSSRMPFTLNTSTNVISAVRGTAETAGVQVGDRLIAINGAPYTNSAQVAQWLNETPGGTRTTADIKHPGDSAVKRVTFALEPVPTSTLGWFGWLLYSLLVIMTPTFCLVLGAWVPLIRPRDHLAWLLLMLMVSFSQMCTGVMALVVLHLWPAWLRTPAIAYHTFFSETWALWMVLFSLYFPDRAPLDRRMPWLKWVVVLPLLVAAVVVSTIEVGDALNFRYTEWLTSAGNVLDRVSGIVSVVSVLAFFAILISRARTATGDACRRLRLLIYGCAVSLTPGFTLTLWMLFTGRTMDQIGELIWIPCVLLLALFPLTLAYVIVVQRALDVRVVLRQGIQYAFATRGIRVAQVGLTAAVIAGMMSFAQSGYNRVHKATIIGIGILLLLRMRKWAEQVRAWTDKKFFREAYNAEQVLEDLGENVRTMVETGPLLKTVADQIAGSLHARSVTAYVKRGAQYEIAYAAGEHHSPGSLPDSSLAVRQMIRERQPVPLDLEDPESWANRFRVQDAERERLRELGARMLIPFMYKSDLIGFLALAEKRSEEPYTRSDLRLLETVGTQTGLALANSQLTEKIAYEVAQREMLNRELHIARDVQQRLFPQHAPLIRNVDLAATCQPATDVGGDYYDFVELERGRLGLAIGDVSGKGIPAALMMASLQASFRGQTISGNGSAARLLTNLNRLMFNASPANLYATFFYGEYDPEQRLLAYGNAAHNKPLLLRRGEVIRLSESGFVIGMFRSVSYKQHTIEIEPGDVLVLFTDGITESMNADQEEFGEDRLIETIRGNLNTSAVEIVQAILDHSREFASGVAQHDDMTALVARFE